MSNPDFDYVTWYAGCYIVMILFIFVVLMQVGDGHGKVDLDRHVGVRVPRPSHDAKEAAVEAEQQSTNQAEILQLEEDIAAHLKMPLKTIKLYWDSFKRYDADGSGSVSHEELKSMLIEVIGTAPAEDEIQRIIREWIPTPTVLSTLRSFAPCAS